MSNAWNNKSAGTSVWGRKYTSANGGAGAGAGAGASAGTNVSGGAGGPMKKPDTDPICAWAQPTKKEEVEKPKGSSGYVPPSKREAPKQSFEEAFPTLGGGAAATKSIEGAMKFGDMAKTRAEKDATIAEVLRKEEAARVAAKNSANSIHQYAVGPNFARYHQAVQAREAEAAYRRRRIFDDETDEEWEEETPEEDSDEFENRSDEADAEEEVDGYDASAFDRHR